MSVDLVCVVADKCIEAALAGLLEHRRPALGLRTISFEFEIHVHPRRDSGCYYDGPDLLRNLSHPQRCAWPARVRSGVARQSPSVRDGDRAGHTRKAPFPGHSRRRGRHRAGNRGLGLERRPACRPCARVGNRPPTIRDWLGQQGFWPAGRAKPDDPKAAMEAALFEKRVPHSSSLYRKLAEKVSLSRCQDPSFQRLKKMGSARTRAENERELRAGIRSLVRILHSVRGSWHAGRTAANVPRFGPRRGPASICVQGRAGALAQE